MKSKLLFVLLIIFSSCSTSVCIYDQDKKIKGERQRFTKFNTKCPTYGKYHNWLWILPIKQK